VIDPSIDDLAAAARAFFPDLTRIVPVIGSTHLVRVETPSGAWAVRRWPPATTEARIRFVHSVLRQARDAGIALVPAAADGHGDDGLLLLGGTHYDAQSWLPGRPLGRSLPDLPSAEGQINLPTSASPALMTNLIETVARFHTASEPLARRPSVPAAPLQRVASVVRRAWEGHRARLRPIAPRTPAVQRWLRVSEQALPAAVGALERQPANWQETSVAGHHDLWPAHVLTERHGDTQQLTGLVDFADLAAGSPLLDLAQLVGHFGGWSAETAELTVETYASIRPLLPEQRRLLPAVAALDLVAEAGWLLVVTYATPRPDDALPPKELRLGADALVASLEVTATVVLHGDTRPSPTTRKWVRRPRRSP
jgi:Ser/Thr protein kinase RdoA (MazF antagonist)